MNNTTTYAYNNAGQVDSETNALGYITTYSFNAMNWMTGKTVPVSSGVNATYTYGFDKVGNQTSVTSPITATQNATSTSKFDAMNRLLKSIDPLGDATSYFYDGAGNNTGIVDPMGNATVYTFNAAGEQIGVSVPLTGSGSNTVFSTTTYTYNAAGYKITKTDALGNTWTYTYTNRGQLSTVTDPLGNQTSYGYDLAGQQTSVTQMVLQNGTYVPGQTTTTNYNSIGQVTQTTSPYNGANQGNFSGNNSANITGTYSATLGGSVTGTFTGTVTGNLLNANQQPIANFTVTVSGTVSGSLSSSGILTGSYSGTGTLATVGGLTGTTQLTFGGGLSGYLSPGTGSLTGPMSLGLSGSVGNTGAASGTVGGGISVIFSGYDSGGETSLGGTYAGTAAPTVSNTYDPVGNLLSQSGAVSCGCGGSGTMTYSYNPNNEQTSMTDGAGDVTTYAYNAVGEQTSTTDPLGNTTTSTFNAQNQLLSTTDASGGVTSYSYNLAGWKLSETDALGNVTQYGYNAIGQKTSETNPLGYQETFAYNPDGSLISQTDYNGQVTQFSYNESGWNTGETWLNAQNQAIYTATITYDPTGQMLSEQDPNSLYNYTYNQGGQLTRTEVTYYGVSSSPLVTLNYGYDSFGNRTSLSDSLGGSIGYTYNGDNQMTGESFALNGTTAAQLSMTYDGLQRLSSITRTDGQSGLGNDTIASTYGYDTASRLTNITYTNSTTSTTLASYTYGYNSANQVSSFQDTSGTSLTYGYDKTGELTSASGTLGGSNYSQSWSYDANGNRDMTGYVTGTGNQLLNDGSNTYTYDKNGNTLTKTNTASGDVWYYTWNYKNQMSSAVEKTSSGTVLQNEQYTYDVEGRLIGVNVNGVQQRWTVFDGSNPYMDFNGAGTAVTMWYVTNPSAYGTLYARVSATGTTNWYLTDMLGSVRQIVDTSGNSLDSIVYDPWGNIVSESNAANGDRFKYDGGVYDAIQQTYLFNARWLNPQSGRWESVDPTGLGPDSNQYRYVSNGPTMLADLSGLADDGPSGPTLEFNFRGFFTRWADWAIKTISPSFRPPPIGDGRLIQWVGQNLKKVGNAPAAGGLAITLDSIILFGNIQASLKLADAVDCGGKYTIKGVDLIKRGRFASEINASKLKVKFLEKEVGAIGYDFSMKVVPGRINNAGDNPTMNFSVEYSLSWSLIGIKGTDYASEDFTVVGNKEATKIRWNSTPADFGGKP